MRLAVVAALSISLAATVAHAQVNANSQILFDTVMEGPLGAWGDYEMRLGADDPVRMRYALVDRTSSQAVVEIESPSPAGPILMMVIFSPSDGRAMTAKIKSNGRTEDLPPAALGAAQLVRWDEPNDGVEEVKTRVGTFSCKKYKRSTPKGDLTIWMSDKVYPSGLVKMTAAGGVVINLLNQGTGATPRFEGGASSASAPSPAKATPPAKAKRAH